MKEAGGQVAGWEELVPSHPAICSRSHPPTRSAFKRVALRVPDTLLAL